MNHREFAARSLRERGRTLSEIAATLGCSKTTVRRLLDPGFAEQQRVLSREAKRRRQGTCVDCGAPTRYAGHGEPGQVSQRCAPCGAAFNGRERTVWTPDVIVAAIREWAGEHGEPPAIPDWSPNHARLMNDEWRAIRFENDPRWPWFATVIRNFGTWNNAIAEAGFTPRAPHGGEGNEQRRRTTKAKAA